ncbi:hypothetical protein [Actinomyces succiniciruminis]|uniref:Prokaryotic membrane lipoprotein lipid attachment site profile n=1 Tax=Actinomyces succiniciruminis TaxID=1522002 RepID=A0A1L7RLQ5_9ACTO|nr:hypothetical protein [Actinomyces succiniciruminis]CED90552.1 Prokaryotic membrane lipoprotein lipid attachment site profile [Actinomyces succiniciruminis]
MTRLSRSATLATTGLTAVALTVSMSACSSGSDSDDTTATTSVSATAAVASSASATPTEDATAMSYTPTEVPDTELVIPLPADWLVLSESDAANEELMNSAATATGQSTDTIISTLQNTSLYILDTTELTGTMTVTVRPVGTGLSTENDFAEIINSMYPDNDGISTEIGDYTTTTTEAGADAVMQTYSVNVESTGEVAYATVVEFTAPDARTVAVHVGTNSAELNQEIIDGVLSSV